MTDGEFMRVFIIGLAVGFVLGVITAGYVALGFREKREDVAAGRRRDTGDATRRLRLAGRNKGNHR